MRAIASSILVFEAVVVLLAIPVAIVVGGVDPWVAGLGGGALVALCLLLPALLSQPWGYGAGWAVQGGLVLTGFVVPVMFFLGGLFAALWAVGLAVARRGEQIRAERWPEADPGAGSPAAEH